MRKADGAGVRKLPLPPPAFRAMGAARAGVFEEAPRGAMEVEEEEGPNVLPLRWWVRAWMMGCREEKDVEGASSGLAKRRLGAI